MCTECAQLQEQLFEELQRLKAAQHALAASSAQNPASAFVPLWNECRKCFGALDEIRMEINNHALAHDPLESAPQPSGVPGMPGDMAGESGCNLPLAAGS